jgi:hypothetical protein
MAGFFRVVEFETTVTSLDGLTVPDLGSTSSHEKNHSTFGQVL